MRLQATSLWEENPEKPREGLKTSDPGITSLGAAGWKQALPTEDTEAHLLKVRPHSLQVTFSLPGGGVVTSQVIWRQVAYHGAVV